MSGRKNNNRQRREQSGRLGKAADIRELSEIRGYFRTF
jgi:hypothetical protein